MRTDFLVLGAGIAGLSYALKAARRFPDRQVCVISKADAQEGNTRYAQGGIAAVQDLVQDSFESHLKDTLVAGAGLCEQEVAEMVVREAPERIKDLLAWEVEFDIAAEGGFHLGREGGHSHHRILHTKDSTGLSIEEALVRNVKYYPNIQLLEHYFALDFLLSEQDGELSCSGLRVLNLRSGKSENIYSRICMLASGGAGQVYAHTTNPLVATGDGIAMALRAGAAIANMEFVQFHPTALYENKTGPAFLITEALRGFGAELRNDKGVAFMKQYDPRGSLAPRDVVARAISQEMHKTSSTHVYLDARKLDGEQLKEHFPMIYEKCLSIGIDITKDLIPVVPAAHYFCGGVKTDTWGRTSLKNLYASGECASTGLHGANRLASNSLLEALVFSHRAFVDSCKLVETLNHPFMAPKESVSVKVDALRLNVLKGYRNELQELMDRYAGIIRSRAELIFLNNCIEGMLKKVELSVAEQPASVPLYELYNLLIVARLVTQAALNRPGSVGLHFLKEEEVALVN